MLCAGAPPACSRHAIAADEALQRTAARRDRAGLAIAQRRTEVAGPRGPGRLALAEP